MERHYGDPAAAIRGRPNRLGWLVAFVAAAIFTELVFYSSLGPLLPRIKSHLGLSTSEAGLLVAAYPIGTLLAVVPVAWMCQGIGVKATTALGLALISTLGVFFAIVHSFEGLLVTRFLQGVGAAGAWSAALAWLVEMVPRDRRGSLVGLALGVSAAGHVAGPAIGALAAAIGRGPGFVTMSALAAGLALAAMRLPAPTRVDASLGLGRALRDRDVQFAAVWASTPAVLMGALLTLGPLRLDGLGIGAGAIGVVYSIAAIGSMLTRPLSGRWSDRHGPHRPLRIGLLASAAAFAGVAVVNAPWLAAVVLIVALTTAGLGAVPGVALMADACDRAGVSQVVAATIINLGFQPGLIIGSAGGGATAAALGVPAAYLLLAALATAAAWMPGAGDRAALVAAEEATSCSDRE